MDERVVEAITTLASGRYLATRYYRFMFRLFQRVDTFFGTTGEGTSLKYRVVSRVGYLLSTIAHYVPVAIFIIYQTRRMEAEVERLGEVWWMEANRRELEAANKLLSNL